MITLKGLFLRFIVLAVGVVCTLIYYFHRESLSLDFNSIRKYLPDVHDYTGQKSPTIVDTIPIIYSLENCPTVKDDMLNVHFILHTHDDPGWLKTPDQYYDEDVRQILFSVFEQLDKNISRKFVYSEIYFFKKWWTKLNSTMRERVTEFVKNGQLEFVGGGWVQNDDALTHYTVAIDQLSYGLNEIKKLFGLKARPAFGWQIDSFGYSREQASLFAQFGFKAEVIQRLPWYDIERRKNSKEMEFYWQGDPYNKIFTHILYDSYVAPAGFRYETDFGNDEVNNSNVKKKFQEMFQIATQRSKSYRSNHLMLLMGHDFVYKKASIWFDSIAKLIEYGNSHEVDNTKINFMFSTPSCYLKSALKAMENMTLSEKSDDFFPYCNNKMTMWTGYFSSRPTLKGLINKISAMLQTVQNLGSATVSNEQIKELLDLMRENLFTTLHHDAITGTCKQLVADNYIRSLLTAESLGQTLLEQIHSKIIAKKLGDNQSKEQNHKTVFFCPLLNISLCSFTQTQQEFAVTIFNGHSKSRSEYINIPVDSPDYVVTNYDNFSLPSQIIKINSEFQQLPKSNGAKYNLVIPVLVPALGFSTCFVKKLKAETKKIDKSEFKNYIENEFYKVSFDATTGLMTEVTNYKQNKTLKLTQTFLWYETPSSGAYIMRPTNAHIINNANVTLKRTEGPLVQEMRQKFDDSTTQIIRLYENKKYIEVEWTVGPIDGNQGKEVVTRFDSKIDNRGTFFTDANGRQLVERRSVLSSPEQPDYPIAAAYYPLTSMITIKDRKTQLMIVTDRAMGGTSLLSGSLELLLHRKVMGDDGAGMGEGLYEVGSDGRPIVVRGVYRFGISNVDESDLNNYWRDLAKDMFYKPILMFSDSINNKDHLPEFSALNGALPDGVHLLTLQNVEENRVLIRLENYFQDSVRTVSLQSIVRVKDCTEMVLSGDAEKETKSEIDTDAIILEPMSIKTLLCSV